MADINKSVEISYRADLKQLIIQLQKMPGVSEQEAKKMVAQLDRQFKRAERSAKKAAKAQSKAMRQVKQSADQAAVSVQDLGDQAGDLDRAFMGAGQAAAMLNPALGEAVMLGSDAAAIFEAMTLGLNALNPIFLGIAGVVGSLAVAFGTLNAKNEKQLDLLNRLREAEEAERDRLSSLADIVTNVSDRYDDAANSLRVFTGQISQSEVDRLQKQKEINRATQADVDLMSEKIRENQRLLSILDREASVFGQMTEAEKELLQQSQLRFESVSNTADLESLTSKGTSARINLEIELRKELAQQEKIRAGIVKRGEQTLEMELELLDLQNEFNKEQEAEEARQERITAQTEAREKLQKSIKSALEQGLTPLEQVEASYDAQIEALEDQKKILGQNNDLRLQFNDALDTLESEKAKAIAELQSKLDEEVYQKRIALIEKQAKFTQQTATALVSATGALLGEQADQLEEQNQTEIESIKERYQTENDLIDDLLARQKITAEEAKNRRISIKESESEAIRAIEERNQSEIDKLRKTEFALNQTASASNIAFRTAEAIMAALATFPGPAGTALAIAAGATGAIQLGTVLSQKPPSSHMGGIIQPDEQLRTVLTGEAVLDRATVNRLGGESGVNNLMANGASGNVIVIQPFRHIDRYNRSARMMAGRKANRRY
jgi:hypothetical protein